MVTRVEAAGRAVRVLAAACPTPPPGVKPFSDEVTGWVQWGSLALIIIASITSVGALVAGKIFHNPPTTRHGAVGMSVAVMAAVLWGVVVGVITGVTHCTA